MLKKKIVIVTGTYSPCVHPPAQRLSFFANEMALKGFEVSVIAATCCNNKKDLPRKKVQVYNLNVPRLFLSFSHILPNPLLIVAYVILLLVLFKLKKYNFILPSIPTGEQAIAGFFASKISDCALILDIRDLYPFPTGFIPFQPPPILHRMLTSFFLYMYRNVNALSVVDENIRQFLIKHGVKKEKIFLIPNGADITLYKPINLKERQKVRYSYALPIDKLIFVYAGSLTPYYPLTDLLKALSVSFPGRDMCHLLIVSYMNYTFYQKLSEKLKIEDRVSFRGPLSVEETARVLAASDVGIVVYKDEKIWKNMFGSKIFSYLSCGLPILASGPYGSVINKLISDNKIGLFVGSPTKEHFAYGFSYFTKNINKISTMGENARKLIIDHYSRQKQAERLILIINDLLNGKKE